MEEAKHFVEWLKRLGYAPRTIDTYQQLLTQLIAWLIQQNHTTLSTVTPTTLKTYQHHLENRKNPQTHQALSGSYIQGHLHILSLLSQYQQHYGHEPLLQENLKTDPFIKQTKTPLTQAEIQQLYESTANDLLGYRDRAMLALYYGCGLRRAEGLNLKESDIDYKHQYLQVIQGKNNQSRTIPICSKALEDLKNYQQYSRSYLNAQTNHLLISYRGKKLTGSTINVRLSKLAQTAHIDKSVCPHLLRHSIATHLLQSGMSLESISQFLGHQRLDSTQIYTHLVEENEF